MAKKEIPSVTINCVDFADKLVEVMATETNKMHLDRAMDFAMSYISANVLWSMITKLYGADAMKYVYEHANKATEKLEKKKEELLKKGAKKHGK